jgi:putative transposase
MIERYCHYGWSRKRICHKWGISIKTFYALNKYVPRAGTVTRRQLNTITAEEIQAVKTYALRHTELNHREMSYRMIDENVAFLSPSSVYRILKKNNLLIAKGKREKPEQWNPHQRLTAPDQIWQTDLMSISYGHRDNYLISYLDVYSRYVVYYKLCSSMTGDTIREVTREALEKTGKRPLVIQSDNGSCYISNEYRSFLSKSNIEHKRIHPHCPNENAEIERYHRTVREMVDPQDAEHCAELYELFKERLYSYNCIRYHSAIGFVPPYAAYTGAAEKIIAERAAKLSIAKRERMVSNFKKYFITVNPEAALSLN